MSSPKGAHLDAEPGFRHLIEGLKAAAPRIVVLTGAGISTESGLPDFRSPGGLWTRYNPAELATIEALERRPLRFYEFYRLRLRALAGADPNPAHFALAELQRQGHIGPIITQNVDGLHQKAGAPDVIELHGTLGMARCHRCGRPHPPEILERPVTTEADIPRCQHCGGAIRPGVVLFGEPLPADAFERALEAARTCAAMLVVGSSLEVFPAADLPRVALERGAALFILNLAPTPYDDRAAAVVRGHAGQVLPDIARAFGVKR